MSKNSSQKSLMVMFSVLLSIILVTFIITIIANGYILEYNNGLKIKATGILSATSLPKNASVIIDEKLYTTTDGSVNLVPGNYRLRIIKEGYLPWSKKINIQKEVVYQAEASLFKSNPTLSPITLFGVTNPTVNHDLTQIIYLSTATKSAKPGLYLVETNYYLSLLLNKYQAKYIAPNPFGQNDTTISFIFSPNSKQVILRSKLKHNTFLIDLNQTETNKIITEITLPNDTIDQEWLLQSKLLTETNINKLPKIFTSTIATDPAKVTFNTNEDKFLYQLDNQLYVYDIEKQLNYFIGNLNEFNNSFWLPKSNSIIYSLQNQIKSVEFDSTNNNTLYSSSYPLNILLPQYDGQKIIISTATSSSTPQNIFSLTIR